MALIIVSRAFAAGNVTLSVLANASGAFGLCLYFPTLMTAMYTLAKRSPCALRFQVAAEGGWDAGGAAGLLSAAGASALGLPLSTSILLSLAGIAALTVMLRRYYAHEAVGQPAAG
jgi:hypothetical protein